MVAAKKKVNRLELAYTFRDHRIKDVGADQFEKTFQNIWFHVVKGST